MWFYATAACILYTPHLGSVVHVSIPDGTLTERLLTSVFLFLYFPGSGTKLVASTRSELFIERVVSVLVRDVKSEKNTLEPKSSKCISQHQHLQNQDPDGTVKPTSYTAPLYERVLITLLIHLQPLEHTFLRDHTIPTWLFGRSNFVY